MNYLTLYLFVVLLYCASCTTSSTTKPQNTSSTTTSFTKSLCTEDTTQYATGFSIQHCNAYTIITIRNPWPNAERSFRYVLYPKEDIAPTDFPNAILVPIPITSVVVTSTTDIPILELLETEKTLIGFPNTNYISSPKTSALVAKGDIQDIGVANALNTEVILHLAPELLIGFATTGDPKNLTHIQQNGIPVLFNGSWMEQHPLGRAEWIKCIAPFFNASAKADTIFSTIETQYHTAKLIAEKATTPPTVVSGSLFKEVWHVPGGKSYVAQFFKDANVNYLWAENPNTGSVQLSFESVLQKAQHAQLWIGAGNASSLKALQETNAKYDFFDAFKNKNVYSYALTTGSNGGMTYFELGPMRPDLIVKDIIKIAHPHLLPEYQLYFFKKLH